MMGRNVDLIVVLKLKRYWKMAHVNTADTFKELKMMVNPVVQIHALTDRDFWKMELVWIASPTQELAMMERDVSLRHAMIDRDCC